MLLTSASLQILTIALAVLATAAALLLWNRVRGPQAVRVAARVGLLAGGYAATAVAVLISVNIAYGGLIVSWSDLFSNLNPPMAPHMRHSGKGFGAAHTGRESGFTRSAPIPGAMPTGAAAGAAAGSGAGSGAATAVGTLGVTPSLATSGYGSQARRESLGGEK